MSKLTESFQVLGIHNGYQYAGNHVFISYKSASGSGAWREIAKWQIHKGIEATEDDPNRERWYWRDHGRKTFNVFFPSTDKADQLEAAKAWAGEKYGITEWVKTPYGDWMDAQFVKRRTAALKARVKELAAGASLPSHSKVLGIHNQ